MRVRVNLKSATVLKKNYLRGLPKMLIEETPLDFRSATVTRFNCCGNTATPTTAFALHRSGTP